MQKWKGKMTLTTNHHPFQICKLLLDRRLKEAGYIYSLLTSRHFLNSKNAFGERLDFLREQWKGKRPNKSCSLSHDEIEQLW